MGKKQRRRIEELEAKLEALRTEILAKSARIERLIELYLAAKARQKYDTDTTSKFPKASPEDKLGWFD